MLDGVNDSDQHAAELVALVADVPCKFNLIPFNPFPQSGFERSSAERIRYFCATLDGRRNRHHYAQNTWRRYRRGVRPAGGRHS